MGIRPGPLRPAPVKAAGRSRSGRNRTPVSAPVATPPLQIDVKPVSPLRLPKRGTPDGMMRVTNGVAERMLEVDSRPVWVRVWHIGGDGTVRLRADALPCEDSDPAGSEQLEAAVERMRFVFGLDDDMSGFFERFKDDPLLGPAIRRKPWYRPTRRPFPWEAVAWAITAQLIEARRAAVIQRDIVRCWGPSVDRPPTPNAPGRGWDPPLRDMPSAELIAGRAPAELAALDLAPKRALAMVQVAREISRGWTDPSRPEDDARLLAIDNIGPWTCQVLGLEGRGDPDSLPAGDLAYVKAVGILAGLGRRATVEEVEEFYAPYAPYRGLAGVFTLIGPFGSESGSPVLRPAA